jgi:hypothetical protein
MLVADKHGTVHPVFHRFGGEKDAVVRVYEGTNFQGIFDKYYSVRNTISFFSQDDVLQIAEALDTLLRHPNKKKTICIQFYGGSHRKLIQPHDLGENRCSYSVSVAGEAFARIAKRIRRINIYQPNKAFAHTHGSERYLLRMDVYLNERNRAIVENNNSLEFIQVVCQDTLTELAIPSFDSYLSWRITLHEDQIRRCGQTIASFHQLKSLDLSGFGSDHRCFEVLLKPIQENMKNLEAIDLSNNNINTQSGKIIHDMLVEGNLLRLDINRIRVHMEGMFAMFALPLFTIIQGCCKSKNIGVVKMNYAMGTSMNEVYHNVVQNFKSGDLKLFEFQIPPEYLDGEQ